MAKRWSTPALILVLWVGIGTLGWPGWRGAGKVLGAPALSGPTPTVPILYRTGPPDSGALDGRVYPLSATGGPDVFGYEYDDALLYDWEEASGGINTGLAGDDVAGGPYDLGFAFPFYGRLYSNVYVSSNGLITFDAPSTRYTNDCIPNGSSPNGFIAPFWDDLAVGGDYNPGAIYYLRGGSEPYRYFVVQWDRVTRLGTSDPMTFQAVLWENGNIDLAYASLSGALDSATVGIENPQGTDGVQYLCNQAGLGSELKVGYFYPRPVALYDHSTTSDISYWVGGNTNDWGTYQNVLASDPLGRFGTAVITELSPEILAQFDTLILPDNAVPDASLAAVRTWFQNSRRRIICVDSCASYAAYSGFLWPSAVGTNGYGTFWDYESGSGDQKILQEDKITEDYTRGSIVGASDRDAQALTLPGDAVALTGKASDTRKTYTAYRSAGGFGTLVLLGPFTPLPAGLEELVRDAVEGPVVEVIGDRSLFPIG
ncbi:MAG: nidogen-like domain-containing protein, partial [Thermodesulfobacteriota bacterium]